VESQQLAGKVTQLESRVATLEDEGKIVKGEVKQILTEIRNTILVRDNPFENESALGRGQAPAPQIMTPSIIEIATHAAPEQPKPPAPHAPEPEPPAREPIPLRATHPAPLPEPVTHETQQPQWSLLTIAGLSAWAEEAMRRLGSLRLEILLDLCEAAGHLPPEARLALARVTELDIPEPEQPPSTNETVVILRQLDALVNDEDEYPLQRRL
jgi:hypothetical protein